MRTTNSTVKSSRDIIIKLIDDDLISGEEAFTLIESIVSKNDYNITTPINIPSVWTTNTPQPYKYEITCSNDSVSTKSCID